MDEGAPIAYTVLERGVPVFASDGSKVGTVHHVVAAPEKDIFHGLVINTAGRGKRFVQASDVASLHERGAELSIDASACDELSEPGGGAPVFDGDLGEMQGWEHWVHKLTLRGDWKAKR